MSATTGRLIAGRYNLVDPIGRGAMGVVWRARDSLLDRDVAIKEVFLNKAIGDDERENSYKRTMREARTAARLSHRSVVTVYDVAEDDGRPWIIMELVPSRSLEKVLTTDGPLPPRRACQVGQQLLAALAAAHAAGVLHRDVKPSNVLIADDSEADGERAVLTDFGIAQFAADPRLTQTGMVMGSPGFTAPERIQGGHATPASDLWSLGATLFAAVEGEGPYEKRGGAITTMSAIIDEDAPPASTGGPLAPLIGMLMNRDPRARPTAASAAAMFAGVLPQLPESQPPPPMRRTPTVVVSAALSKPADAPQGPLSRTPTAPGDSSPLLPAEPTALAGNGSPQDPLPAGTSEDPVTGPGPDPDEAVGGTSEDPVTETSGANGAATGGPAPESPLAEPGNGDAGDDEPAGGTAGTIALVKNEPSPAGPPPMLADGRDEPRTMPQPAAPEPSTEPAYPSEPWPGRGSWRGPDPVTQQQPWPGQQQTWSRPDAWPQQEPWSRPRRRRRGRWGAVSVVVVALIAVIGAVAAWQPWQSSGNGTSTGTAADANQPPAVRALNGPRTSPSAGWRSVAKSPSELGTTEGFSIGLPPGWLVRQSGLTTYLDAPDGVAYLKVDLTPRTQSSSLAEAEYVQNEGIKEGDLPGYSVDKLQPAPIRGTSGAFWSYTWVKRSGVTMRVDDLLFATSTQPYAVDFTSTAAGFQRSLPLFEQILRTFQVTQS